VSRILQSLLFGISPLDPFVFGAVSLFLAAVAFAAGYGPARRATRIDPMLALRHE
jgi:ABC-type antimicrobial peptide transport system permease subunit